MEHGTKVLALTVVGLLALACGEATHATGDGSGAATERGTAHVEATCMGCHPGVRLDEVVRKRAGEQRDAAALDAFLTRHHAADAGLRAEVVSHLLERLEREAPSP